MKTAMIFGVIMFLSVNGCQKDFEQINDTLDIIHGVPVIISHNNILTIDSVKDSRCPTEVVCFWAGNAVVSFTFKQKQNNVSFDLNTFPGFRTDTLINHYRFTLKRLTPENSTDNPPALEDYNAEVIITTE